MKKVADLNAPNKLGKDMNDSITKYQAINTQNKMFTQQIPMKQGSVTLPEEDIPGLRQLHSDKDYVSRQA